MRYFLLFSFCLCCTCSYSQDYNDESPHKYRFAYKSTVFKGTKYEITKQLRTFKEHPNYKSIPENIQLELNTLFLTTKEQVFPRRYRKKALLFLEAIDRYKAFIEFYNTRLYKVIQKLRRDINKIDFKLEKEFTKAKVALDRIEKENIADSEEIGKIEKEYNDSHLRLLGHRWMQEKFNSYTTYRCVESPDSLILDFKKKHADVLFNVFTKNKIDTVDSYLENEIIDYYYKRAITDMDPEALHLQYINKI